MKNEKLKRMKTILFSLGIILFFSSFTGDNEYIMFTCPDGMAYSVQIDACVPEEDVDGEGLVCILRKVKTGEIIFACDPKGKKDNCNISKLGHSLSCPNSEIKVNEI